MTRFESARVDRNSINFGSGIPYAWMQPKHTLHVRFSSLEAIDISFSARVGSRQCKDEPAIAIYQMQVLPLDLPNLVNFRRCYKHQNISSPSNTARANTGTGLFESLTPCNCQTTNADKQETIAIVLIRTGSTCLFCGGIEMFDSEVPMSQRSSVHNTPTHESWGADRFPSMWVAPPVDGDLRKPFDILAITICVEILMTIIEALYLLAKLINDFCAASYLDLKLLITGLT